MSERADTGSPRSSRDRIGELLASPAAGWVAVAMAMAGAAVLILVKARDLSFTADELYTYARLVDSPAGPVPYEFGLEYLLAPHNGHLSVGGKVIYEVVFATFGSSHVPFRVLAVAGVLAGAGLFFALAYPRVGVGVATVATISLLFLGAAWEVMLWPFDLSTTYALAAGLAALVALDRRGPAADALACTLLVASVAMIEVGLTFIVIVAVLILVRRDRLRRAWVFGVPLLLYASWWLWSRRFEQSDVVLSNLSSLPGSLAESLAAVSAALTGQYAHGEGVFASVIDPNTVAAVVACAIALAMLWRVIRGGVTVWTWAVLAGLGVYWSFIALAARPEDSSRYMWVGTILVLLAGAGALQGRLGSGRAQAGVALGLVIAFAFALPAGLEKLSDGRNVQLNDARASRTHYAMLEFAGDRTDPAYVPARDPFVARFGPSPAGGISAGSYLSAERRIGGLGYSLEEIEELPVAFRRIGDAVLARALGIGTGPGAAPSGGEECAVVATGEAGGVVEFALPPGGARLRPLGPERVELGLGRFSAREATFQLEALDPGAWTELEIPGDDAPTPWRGFAEGGLRYCPL